jgi:Fic family protein
MIMMYQKYNKLKFNLPYAVKVKFVGFYFTFVKKKTMISLENYHAGFYEKGTSGYSWFVPTKVNDTWNLNDPTLDILIEKAALKLGELNAFSKLVPNIDLFIQLHVTKEAVISSRIEGTKTSMNEALLEEEEVNPERRNDWKEVNNYIKALNFAVSELEQLPISSRLIRNTHAILLNSVRGEHKQPGEYRKSQNWIGGSSPGNATFVPPHHKYLNELMGDLENFIHNEAINLPALIKIAIAHYQFETIHPFLDGNGRIGRLLFTLFLVDQKVLNRPLLYLSEYFDKHRGLYYDNLTFVRTKNDMTQWLKFVLAGVAETAEKSTATLSKLLALKADTENLIYKTFGRKSHHAALLLQALLKKPVTNVSQSKNTTGLSFKAANNLVADFVSAGILQEMTGQSRNRVFVFKQYLNLF